MQAKIDLMPEGIAIVDYGENAFISHQYLSEALAQYKAELIGLFPHIDALPIYMKAPGLKGMSKKAIDLVQSEEMCEVVCAMACVPGSVIERGLLRVFLWSFQPPYDFRSCAKDQEAIDWLAERKNPKFTQADYLLWKSTRL